MKKFTQRLDIRRLALFGAYVAITGCLAFHHEPWRDEADNWLMARDASVIDTIMITPDSGHPPLWYLLLKPFALAGFPPWTQKIVHLFLAWTSGWLLLFRSPLPLLACAAMLSSYFFSFEYAAVARNYALGILGLFAWCASVTSGKKREPSVLVASVLLMAFSTTHFLMLAAGVLAFEGVTALDNKLKMAGQREIELDWKSYAVACAAVITSVICLWPTGHGQLDAAFFPQFHKEKVQLALRLAILPSAPQFIKGWWSDVLVLTGWSSVIAASLINLRRRDPGPMVFLVIGLAGLLYIFGFRYFFGTLRHAGILYVLCVATFWLTLRRGDAPSLNKQLCLIFFLATFTLTIPRTMHTWRTEIERPFSNAGDTAEYLLNRGLGHRTLSCHPAPNCSAILLQLPAGKQAWQPGTKSWGTHMWWDKTYIKQYAMTPQVAMAETVKKFGPAGESPDPGVLFLTPTAVQNPGALGMRLVYSTPRNAWGVHDEAFFIYAVKSSK
ncbi:MAG: hypothetical protein RIQ81_934 [Pseudomonadota bacterium]